ncbi:MAG: DsrE family protein [Aquificae bacterium]|nr:DsrE family protein [Aquificota bacterium]
MNLLIVLASNPYSHDFNTAVKIAKASLERKHKTKMFLMGNGLYCLPRVEIKQLVEEGLQVYYCAHNAQQRNVKPEEWAESSSMYGLSKLMTEADKVIMLD